ncbi:MAG: D-erythronate dehydrogenase [Bacteroidia bacterium]|nr:D-erythronate dehydrogenase [Bacteroidia bacterium]
MQILITGAAGFIGKKLAKKLLDSGTITLNGGEKKAFDQLVLFDVVPPEGLPDDVRITVKTGNIADPAVVNALVNPATSLVFHLAAIVSANAEENFDLGFAVNVDGTRYLLEACRRLGTQPMMVFSSSVGIYGGNLPETGHDDMIITPTISYGTQKTIGELLVNEYSRKGFIDGRSLRLPTIMVRPGKPNRAASTFASSIIREPLTGQKAICPVDPQNRMYILSPRRVIEALIKAVELPAETWGWNRMLTLPGISASIREMVDALETVAGKEVASLIEWKPDPLIEKIVSGWLHNYDAQRAKNMGFRADNSMEEIIRAHIEDELGGKITEAMLVGG